MYFIAIVFSIGNNYRLSFKFQLILILEVIYVVVLILCILHNILLYIEDTQISDFLLIKIVSKRILNCDNY